MCLGLLEELVSTLISTQERRDHLQKVPSFLCTLYNDVLDNNGLPVCAMRERVNRYTVNFVFMLTTSATYGKMFLDRKGCGRRWIDALKERGYGWRLRVVCDWQQK